MNALPPVAIENAREGLHAFLAALASLEGPTRSESPGQVRVLHFGDSHVAADFWSGELRARLQARFGDGGPGYVMPGRPWRHFRHGRARSLGGGWEVLGLGAGNGPAFVGLSGTSLAPRSEARPAGVLATASQLEVQVGLPEGAGCVRVLVDGELLFAGELGAEPTRSSTLADPPLSRRAVVVTRLLPEDGREGPGGQHPLEGQCQAVAFIRIAEPIPLTTHVVEVEGGCGGRPLILGVDLGTGAPGITVDTLGLNGAELARLGRWSPGLRATLLRHADPRLVIVSYGANDMASDTFSPAGYRVAARALLAGLRVEVPDASILVTGPFDRSTRRPGRHRDLVRANAAPLVAALRAAALDEGCAFWDARAAMGGEGSIRAWKAAGLAQGDLVHLTQAGYEKLGRMLHDRLVAALDEHQATCPSPGAAPAPAAVAGEARPAPAARAGTGGR